MSFRTNYTLRPLVLPFRSDLSNIVAGVCSERRRQPRHDRKAERTRSRMGSDAPCNGVFHRREAPITGVSLQWPAQKLRSPLESPTPAPKTGIRNIPRLPKVLLRPHAGWSWPSSSEPSPDITENIRSGTALGSTFTNALNAPGDLRLPLRPKVECRRLVQAQDQFVR